MSRSNAIKGFGFVLWLLAVAGVITALYYKDEFLALENEAVAWLKTRKGFSAVRAEGEIRWEGIGPGHGFVDGDWVATGRVSKSLIDFGRKRSITMFEDTQIKIVSLKNAGDLTFLISLLRGTITVKNCKGCPPFIIKAGGEEVPVLAGESRGIYLEAGKTPQLFEVKGPRPGSKGWDNSQALSKDFLKDPPKLPPVSRARGLEMTVASRDASGRLVPTTYWTLRPVSSLRSQALKFPLAPPKRRPRYGSYTPLLKISGADRKGKGQVIKGKGLKAQSITIPVPELRKHATVKRHKGGMKEYIWSLTGGAAIAGKNDDGKIDRYQSFGKESKKYSIKTLGEFPGGPVSLGFDKFVRKAGRSLWIRPKRHINPNEAPFAIHMVNSQDMPRFYPYFRGADSVGRSRRGLYSAKGVFIVRGGGVVAQLRGSGMDTATIKKVFRLLRGDFVFEGSRSAFNDTKRADLVNWIGALLDKGKVIYVLKRKKLYPVSRSFIKTNSEVAQFIDQQAKAIFLERVKIIDYRK